MNVWYYNKFRNESEKNEQSFHRKIGDIYLAPNEFIFESINRLTLHSHINPWHEINFDWKLLLFLFFFHAVFHNICWNNYLFFYHFRWFCCCCFISLSNIWVKLKRCYIKNDKMRVNLMFFNYILIFNVCRDEFELISILTRCMINLQWKFHETFNSTDALFHASLQFVFFSFPSCISLVKTII